MLPAPDFSPLHAVEAQPAAESPAPAIRLAMLSPAKSFRNSFLSISTSSSAVHKRTHLHVIHQKKISQIPFDHNRRIDKLDKING
jgi:hypothetical protein